VAHDPPAVPSWLRIGGPPARAGPGPCIGDDDGGPRRPAPQGAHLDVQWRVISRSAPGRGYEPGLPGQPKVAVAAFGHRRPLAANPGLARASVSPHASETSCPRGPHRKLLARAVRICERATCERIHQHPVAPVAHDPRPARLARGRRRAGGCDRPRPAGGHGPRPGASLGAAPSGRTRSQPSSATSAMEAPAPSARGPRRAGGRGARRSFGPGCRRLDRACSVLPCCMEHSSPSTRSARCGPGTSFASGVTVSEGRPRSPGARRFSRVSAPAPRVRSEHSPPPSSSMRPRLSAARCCLNAPTEILPFELRDYLREWRTHAHGMGDPVAAVLFVLPAAAPRRGSVRPNPGPDVAPMRVFHPKLYVIERERDRRPSSSPARATGRRRRCPPPTRMAPTSRWASYFAAPGMRGRIQFRAAPGTTWRPPVWRCSRTRAPRSWQAGPTRRTRPWPRLDSRSNRSLPPERGSDEPDNETPPEVLESRGGPRCDDAPTPACDPALDRAVLAARSQDEGQDRRRNARGGQRHVGLEAPVWLSDRRRRPAASDPRDLPRSHAHG
jgi:hypothetical protein